VTVDVYGHLVPRSAGGSPRSAGAAGATAILDRLLHHASTVTIKGDSYRRREKKKAGLLGRTPSRRPSSKRRRWEQAGSQDVGPSPGGHGAFT
jgi:hypothetical protein